MTASPRVPAIHGLPLPVVPGLLFPADCFARGANLAHDTRCPAVGNRDISMPISAMSSWAPVLPTPGISSSWATWCDHLPGLRGELAGLSGERVDAVQHHAQQP